LIEDSLVEFDLGVGGEFAGVLSDPPAARTPPLAARYGMVPYTSSPSSKTSHQKITHTSHITHITHHLISLTSSTTEYHTAASIH
jgi:hypothetical protein